MSLFFVALALLRGLVYAVVIPPWQAPDEHGHFEYAWLVSQHGPFVGPEAVSPALQQAVLSSMARFDFWRYTRQPTPEGLPDGFLDPTLPLLSDSPPQVGDERPLYYWLVGGLLWLLGGPDLLTSLYVGRLVSVVLFAAAVGMVALGMRALFPRSILMQIVPPAFVLSLPMLGQMGSAFHSDALGVLTGTLFFVGLIPIFRDGLTWRRGVLAAAVLGLALLSKKTALFLAPAALLVVPARAWVRRMALPRRGRVALAIGGMLLVGIGIVLALLPSSDAAGWREWSLGCGPTRVRTITLSGEAALRVGACPGQIVSQSLPPATVEAIAGRTVDLQGWIRGAGAASRAEVSVWDSEGSSRTVVAVEQLWQPFTVTHAVDPDATWVGVRLAWSGPGGAVLVDDLVLSAAGGSNVLDNGSAERAERLLFDLLSDSAQMVGVPRRTVERILAPYAWGREAWQYYREGATLCIRSFWGDFGWLALSMPANWYRVLNSVVLIAGVGLLIFWIRGPRRSWQAGYVCFLVGAVVLLAMQTFLPLIGSQGKHWLPQGRYLFPGIFALSTLVAWGLSTLMPSTFERWGALIAVLLFVGFDLLSLGYLIGPYFYRS